MQFAQPTVRCSGWEIILLLEGNMKEKMPLMHTEISNDAIKAGKHRGLWELQKGTLMNVDKYIEMHVCTCDLLPCSCRCQIVIRIDRSHLEQIGISGRHTMDL